MGGPWAVLVVAGVLIEAGRGRLDLEPHVTRRADEESFLSVITASELLHGVRRAVRPDQRARRSAFVEGVLERLPLLEIDLATARAPPQVWSDLSEEGTLIGHQDLWLTGAGLATGTSLGTAHGRGIERASRWQAETVNTGGGGGGGADGGCRARAAGLSAGSRAAGMVLAGTSTSRSVAESSIDIRSTIGARERAHRARWRPSGLAAARS